MLIDIKLDWLLKGLLKENVLTIMRLSLRHQRRIPLEFP